MKNIINEDVLDRVNDSYLDEVFKEFKASMKNVSKREDFIQLYSNMNNVFKVMAYRPLLTPIVAAFHDSKLEYLFERGRLPEGFDLMNHEKIETAPLYADIRIKGSDDPYERYIMVITSSDQIKDLDGYSVVALMDYKDLYERYIKNDESIKGIILNPYREQYIIDRNLCEYIYHDCPDSFWNEYLRSKMDRVDQLLEEGTNKI